MIMIKKFLRSSFVWVFTILLLVGLVPLFVYSKGEIELIINQNHQPFFDDFFRYVTHLGDGMMLAILVISLLFYNYLMTILTAFSIAVQAIFVSVFKRWIFNGLERPLAFFDEGAELYLVDGVDVHSYNTFPSGHTATIFTFVALIFILMKNKSIITASVLLCIALLVGFSRVYLLQHFVIDVYFGAIIGVLSVVLGMYFIEIMFSTNQIEKFRITSLRSFISGRKRI